MTKTIFWFLIGLVVAVSVMLLGTALNIANPWTWFSYVVVAAVALIVGYVLGRKANSAESTESTESDEEEKR